MVGTRVTAKTLEQNDRLALPLLHILRASHSCPKKLKEAFVARLLAQLVKHPQFAPCASTGHLTGKISQPNIPLSTSFRKTQKFLPCRPANISASHDPKPPPPSGSSPHFRSLPTTPAKQISHWPKQLSSSGFSPTSSSIPPFATRHLPQPPPPHWAPPAQLPKPFASVTPPAHYKGSHTLPLGPPAGVLTRPIQIPNPTLHRPLSFPAPHVGAAPLTRSPTTGERVCV